MSEVSFRRFRSVVSAAHVDAMETIEGLDDKGLYARAYVDSLLRSLANDILPDAFANTAGNGGQDRKRVLLTRISDKYGHEVVNGLYLLPFGQGAASYSFGLTERFAEDGGSLLIISHGGHTNVFKDWRPNGFQTREGVKSFDVWMAPDRRPGALPPCAKEAARALIVAQKGLDDQQMTNLFGAISETVESVRKGFSAPRRPKRVNWPSCDKPLRTFTVEYK